MIAARFILISLLLGSAVRAADSTPATLAPAPDSATPASTTAPAAAPAATSTDASTAAAAPAFALTPPTVSSPAQDAATASPAASNPVAASSPAAASGSMTASAAASAASASAPASAPATMSAPSPTPAGPALAVNTPATISGPYLAPPLPPAVTQSVVDSADMVPPTTSADPAMPPPAPSGSSAPASGSTTPASDSVTVNLIQLMVKRGLITKDDASSLVKQATLEAAQAKATANAVAAPTDRPASEKANIGPDGLLRTPPAAPAGGDTDDAVAVSYVPDVVRNQIRDEVKADVMQQARNEGLTTAKDDVPEWVHRFHITGDVRTRYEGDFFPDGNATGQIVNFNAINTGSPFDINTLTQKSGLIPTYNVDADRDRFRLRARIGAEIDLGAGWSAGMRLGTGSDDQPVSENQTLGAANGQGGNFSKYQIWLDRAFIRYELSPNSKEDLSFSIGRFDNPFFSTSMIWADDIAFDGVMARASYEVADGVKPFAVAGAFPIFNTDLNFGTNSNVAGNGYASEDKYLFAGQTGVDWKINKDFDAKGAVAFYDFENIQGKVSDPISQDEFASLGTNVSGTTDDSRPSFAQHGNTYMALRDVQLDPALPATPVYEYFGLASKFQELALTGQLDYSHFDPVHVWLVGEFVDNVAFDKNQIENSGPAILPGPQNNNDGTSYAGGSMGYNIRLGVGTPALQKLWDWNVNLTYRYLESDAVVDAFNDADFGGYMTGTNLKGYIIGGNLAITSKIWTSVRFLSADAIAGPPLHDDTLQLDLNAKF